MSNLTQELKDLFPRAKNILIVRKNIKHGYIRVEPQLTIQISAGNHISETQIHQWCIMRQKWVNQILEKQILKSSLQLYQLHKQHHFERTEQELKNLLLSFIEKWQPLICIPVQRIRINSNMTRAWGKCYYEKGLITFSNQLKYAATESIEYVVVHEMVHLLIHDHSVAFWTKVGELLPDWEYRRSLLNS